MSTAAKYGDLDLGSVPHVTTVEEFLVALNISHLLPKFTARGVTTIEHLLHLIPSDIDAMGIRAGVRVRLLKGCSLLREHNSSERSNVDATASGTTTPRSDDPSADVNMDMANGGVDAQRYNSTSSLYIQSTISHPDMTLYDCLGTIASCLLYYSFTFRIWGWCSYGSSRLGSVLAGRSVVLSYLVSMLAMLLGFWMTGITVNPIQAPGKSYFADFVADYRRRRDRLCGALDAAGFTTYVPAGTYFVLADHTSFDLGDDVAFCRHLIEHVGVAAIPPSAFYHDPAEGRDLVRFAFCKSTPVLEAAIDRLQALRG